MSSQCGRAALPNVLLHVARLRSKNPVCRSHYLTSLRSHEGQIIYFTLLTPVTNIPSRHCMAAAMATSFFHKQSGASVTARSLSPHPVHGIVC